MNVKMFRKMLKTYVDGKVYIWDEDRGQTTEEYSSIEEFIHADTLKIDEKKLTYANLYFEDEDDEPIPEQIPRIIKSLTLEISVSNTLETDEESYTIADVSKLVEPYLICDIDDQLYRSITSGQYLNESFGEGEDCEYFYKVCSSIHISIGSLARFEYELKRAPHLLFSENARLLAFELSPL